MTARSFSRSTWLLVVTATIVVGLTVIWSSIPHVPGGVSATVLATARPTAALTETRESTFVGQVLDESNRPLKGAKLTAFDTDMLRSLGEGMSDDAGRFRLSGLPVAQTFRVVATLRGYRSSTLEVTLDHPSSAQERTFSLAQGHSLSGRVIDQNQAPVAGAVVGSSDSVTDSTQTNASGYFTLEGLPKSPVNLFARAPGYAPRHLRGISPGQTNVALVVEPAASLQGEVTIPSTVGDMQVSLCHIDSDFKKEICVARQLLRPPATQYRFHGVPSGKFELIADAAGYPLQRKAVVLLAGQELTGPTLTFAR